MTFKIIRLDPANQTHIEQIAQFLHQCFRKYSPDWLPTISDCRQEIAESFEPGRSSLVMLDEQDHAIGWTGAIWDENVWEIHPIAVSPNHQHQGVGAALVNEICQLARQNGAAAIWAGTSDETGATNFSQTDLYTNPIKAMEQIEAPDDHAINFWRHIGFTLVGVLPDAEGRGKPGIHFAKSLA